MKSGVSGLGRSAGRMALGGLVLLLSGLSSTAEITTDWDISYSYNTDDFDRIPANGLERQYKYLIRNLATPNVDAANMIEVTFHAGSNQGVYFAGESTGNWLANIMADKTVFYGNGHAIGPAGGDNTFHLYSLAGQETGEGTIEALAAGDGIELIPFPDKTVTLPIANFATNQTSVGWLKAQGYTNEFDAAALADPDLDGFENWQEYHSDTDPTNMLSFLQLTIATNRLAYSSSTNCAYTLEWCGNLSSNVWNTFTNLPGTGTETGVSDTNNAASRFYRLKAERM